MNPYLIPGFLGIALQVCVLHLLIRGAYRRFPGITLYLMVLFLTGIVDASAFVESGWWPDWYYQYYYLNNTIRHLSGFVALVSLVYRMSRSGERQGNLFRISFASLAVIAASALLAGGAWPNEYMNEASRNLSFATVVLTVALWLAMVKNRTRDVQLFLVTGGLGLNMAGEAIAQSLLRISGDETGFLFHAGNIIGITSHLLCLLIWWKAFRQPAVEMGATPNHPRDERPQERPLTAAQRLDPNPGARETDNRSERDRCSAVNR